MGRSADYENGKMEKSKEASVENVPLNDFSTPTKESRKLTWAENLSSYFSQYCGATSIHGVQYLGERGRYIIEKIVWVAILVCVWYLCGSLIKKSYDKWKTSPVIVTFATTETPIWNIPFPAVTICPEVKFSPESMNYSGIYMEKLKGRNVSKEEELTFRKFLLICDQFNQSNLLPNFTSEKFVDDSTFMDILLEFIFLVNDVTEYGSTWLGKKIQEEHMSFTFTERGICYSFNMLNVEDILKSPESFLSFRISDLTKATKWSLEDGYSDDSNTHDTYPQRTFTSGISGGANFILYTKNDYIDHFCGDGLEGFKVILHHPSEFPDMDRHIQLSLNEALNIGIKPRMITVKDDLRDYSPEARNCYYSDQRQLAYFKNYSQNNCFSECLANYTLAKCGCIPFYLPKDNNSSLCGGGSQDCVNRCKVRIGKQQVPSKSNKQHCDCLPSCTSLEYDVETSQSKWNWRNFFLSLKQAGKDDFISFDLDLQKDHFSRLSVYYKEVQFLTSERHELYGYVDFFSNTGGLLGLFIGFSVTSAIEILYFLTLRLACNLKKFGQKLWSGDEELLKEKNNDDDE